MSDFPSDCPSEEAVLEPKRIQVVAILHIVFAGLGLVGVIFSLVMIQLEEVFLKMFPTAPGMEEYTRVSMELMEKVAPLSYLGVVFSLTLGILLLVAGVLLLKRRSKALKWSNAYAWTSISLKVVGLGLFFAVTMPILNELIEPVMEYADPGLKAQLIGLKISTVLSGVLTPLLGMIYPFLTLKMLNNDQVRQHLK